MKWLGCARRSRSARTGAYLLAAASVCSGAFPQPALAAPIQACVIFEIDAASDQQAAAENLRSTSLSNCKRLIGHAGSSAFGDAYTNDIVGFLDDTMGGNS